MRCLVRRVPADARSADRLFVVRGPGAGVLYANGSDIGVLDAVRLIYMWILPAVIFMIGRQAPWGAAAWSRLEKVILVWVAVSAFVSWDQFVHLRYPVGDDITGLNKDAHANGTLMMFAALQFIAYGLFHEQRNALLIAFAFLITMVLSSVLKVMFFGVVAVAVSRKCSCDRRHAGAPWCPRA